MTRILCIALALTLAALGAAPQARAAEVPRWDAETLDTLSRLPIQDEGRVKPLSTFATFELVKINGRMQCESPEGERVSAMYWLMDCFFAPETARQYQNILIENPQVMQAIGLDDTKKRTRFRYDDLVPHEEALLTQARQASQKEDKERNMFERQILNLYSSYADYTDLLRAMDFARLTETIAPDSPLAAQMKEAGIEPDEGGGYRLSYAEMLAYLPQLVSIYQAGHQDHDHTSEVHAPSDAPIDLLLGRLERVAGASTALTIFPPISTRGEEWLSPGSMLQRMLHEPAPAAEYTQLAQLQHLAAHPDDRAAMRTTAGELIAGVQTGARSLDQLHHLDLEVFYYKMRFFYWSLVLYVLALVIVSISWLAPRNRWLGHAAMASVLVPTVLLVVGITLRCIIRGRPPVTTLYETTLFIPAVAICVALVAEFINRRRVALSVAAVIGALGLFLAHNYELRGPDTMESMIAVLNSNFWLSTHVTTVTIGYSAGLLACAMAHVYILGQIMGFGRNKAFFRNVARMTYGVICFGALFAFVGTVLGGIWANNSWGRFWGWDPKENGALLIILWDLFILHARMGGYLRDLGVAIAAVFGGIIVAFSWWGVNLLQVGLHSYGFISGVQTLLNSYYLLELVVIGLGVMVAIQRAAARRAQTIAEA